MSSSGDHPHATRHSSKLPPSSKHTANSRVVHTSKIPTKLPRKLKKKSRKNSVMRRQQIVDVTSDEAPQRLVNPLMEFHGKTAADYLPLLDICHGRPDTYPIAYQARLLGLKVPETIHVGDGVEGIAQQILLANRTEEQQKPPSASAAAIPRGNFYSSWQSDKDRLTLVDPTFTKLQTDPKLIFRPIAAPQYQKLAQSVAWDPQPLVEWAQHCGLFGPDAAQVPVLNKLVQTKRMGWVLSGRAAISYQVGWYGATGPGTELVVRLEMLQHATGQVNFMRTAGSNLPLEVQEEAPAAKNNGGSSAASATTPAEGENTDDLKPTAVQNLFPEVVTQDPTTIVQGGTQVTEDSEISANANDKLGESDAVGKQQAQGGDEAADSQSSKVPCTEHSQGDNETYSITEGGQEGLWVFLMAAALEHSRACGVYYVLADLAPGPFKELLQTYFGMTSRDAIPGSRTALVCDLSNCGFRHAFLKFKEKQNASTKQDASISNDDDLSTDVQRTRSLVRWPLPDEIRTGQMSPARTVRGSKKAANTVTALPAPQRDIEIRMRAKLLSPESVECRTLSIEDGRLVEGQLIELPPSLPPVPNLDILRTFEPPAPPTPAVDSSEICKELSLKEAELDGLEGGLQGKLQSLLTSVVQERVEYEQAAQQRERDREILAENVRLLQRRKELDLAFQEQLEQDMDAVCDICHDGEVTPDNQILFCEACNVAVHQICYGVERVPEGDYYCLACTHLGRNNNRQATHAGDIVKLAATPLPICCELCPLKQGAFIQTNMKPKEGENASFGKWVHVVCAKWQGLNFVDNERTDMIEDVTDVKIRFRQHNIACALCRGERGSMIKCRVEECKKWIHVTCARAVGTCDVVHGENAAGPVEVNPWTLMCPEHSVIEAAEVREGSVPVEKLILIAKEFPPEPKPPPEAIIPKPFNTVGGAERDRLLANEKYEQELLKELTTKKMYGFRCEVCDTLEDEGKNVSRCPRCLSICCSSCIFDSEGKDGNFKCVGCRFSDDKKKTKEAFDPPSCVACCQPGGILRKGFANPVSRKSFWHHNLHEKAKSFFGKPFWVHSVCAFWNPKLRIQFDTSEVDCSDVVMFNGKGLIRSTTRCHLCGQARGLKIQCNHEACSSRKMCEQESYHVTCARLAGLEVNTVDDGDALGFFMHCYRHGSNEHNLRAKIEDLLEIEKRRAGKCLNKSHLPMTFAHAQRLLNSSIQVMRILGWAWRWAEWWVDYNSSWEPLLEPGQRESDMSNEELKKVDSTRESRCSDARKCRLTALGVALRERLYDNEAGFDREALDRALRALLSTRSLVGPMEDFELKFLIEWLGRAYRSRSKLLGYGPDRIIPMSAKMCRHIEDQSPKFILGSRPVPGKQILPKGEIFESDIKEADDFLRTEVLSDTPSRRHENRIGSPGRGRGRGRVGRPPSSGRGRVGRPPSTGRGRGGRPPSSGRGRVGRPPSSGRGRVCRPPSAGRGRVGRPPSTGRGRGGRPPSSRSGRGGGRLSGRGRGGGDPSTPMSSTAGKALDAVDEKIAAVAAVVPSAVKKRHLSRSLDSEAIVDDAAATKPDSQSPVGGSGTPKTNADSPSSVSPKKRRSRWIDRKYQTQKSDTDFQVASGESRGRTEAAIDSEAGSVRSGQADQDECSSSKKRRGKRDRDEDNSSDILVSRVDREVSPAATSPDCTKGIPVAEDPKKPLGEPSVPMNSLAESNRDTSPAEEESTDQTKLDPERPEEQTVTADASGSNSTPKIAQTPPKDAPNATSSEIPVKQSAPRRRRRSAAKLEMNLNDFTTPAGKRSRRPTTRYDPTVGNDTNGDRSTSRRKLSDRPSLKKDREDEIPLAELAGRRADPPGNIIYSPSKTERDSEDWRVQVRRSAKKIVVSEKLEADDV